MTDHNTLTMRHAERQIKDAALVEEMLKLCPVCTLVLQDEKYPYAVPLNFGYCWEEKLTIYMHMASEGYKLSLLEKNPHVACNAYAFVDRSLGEKYRGESQDYRSVTVFGKAEIITANQPLEFLRGLNAIQSHYKRKPISQAPKTDKLVVVKLTADAVTAKSMYPLMDVSEVPMPLQTAKACEKEV